MSETEAYIREKITEWVWSGFHNESETRDMLLDILEEDVDANKMRAVIAEEFAKKRAAEKSWPKVTDCDRLDRAFVTLDADGVCAVQNAGYTMSDGYSAVAEALHARGRENYRGYCFYHGQDLERAIHGHGLTIAFGDLDDDQARTVMIGRAVCAALNEAGFATDWDCRAENRIEIPRIDWKRRY